MSRRTRVWVMMCCFSLFTAVLYGQSPYKNGQLSLYSLDQNIADRNNLDLVQDDVGYTWVCLQRDVQLWDGNEFVSLKDLYDGPEKEFPCKEIWLHDNRLIIQSFYNEDQVAVFNVTDGTYHEVTVQSDWLRQKGTLLPYWIQNDKNTTIVSLRDTLSVIPLQDIELDHPILTELSDDRLLLLDRAFRYVITSVEGEVLKSGQINAGRPEHPFQVIVDQHNRLWIALEQSDDLLEINLQTESVVRTHSFSNYPVKSMFKDDQGQILVGTSSRELYFQELYFITDDGNLEDWSDVIELEENFAYLRSNDFTKDLWLATYNGLEHIVHHPRPISPIYKREESEKYLDGYIVRDITGSDSIIYFTKEVKYSPPYQFRIDDIDHVTQVISPDMLEFQCNQNMAYIDDYIYRSGCNRKNSGRLERFDIVNNTYDVFVHPYRNNAMDVHNREIYLAAEDRNNETGSYVLVFNTDSLTYKTARFSGHLTPRRYMHLDVTDDHIWLATTKGVAVVDRSTSQISSFLKEEIGGIPLVYIKKYGDELFIGTELNGLYIYKFSTQSTRHIGYSEGLKNKTVASAFPHEDNIWIATFNGLYLAHREHGIIQSFNESSGLSNNEFNRFALYNFNDEKLYLGTINGITQVDFTAISSLASHQVCIKRIETYRSGNEQGNRYYLGGRESAVTITKGFSKATFDVDILGTPYQQTPKFMVRIMGYDPEWRIMEEDKIEIFSDISAGYYTMELRAIDDFGNVSDTTSFQIEVKNRYWESIWFLIIAGLFILSGIATMVYFYVKRVKESEAEKTEMNRKMSDLELMAFRAQMNPHFIFNALGSIQYFINTADTKSADDYLTKFGKLMRRFLESSKTSYTALDNELDLLSHYLDLEKLRAEGKFDYLIDVDEEVYPEDVRIPSMILQPFVENAILHGISNLSTRNGMIKLIITLQGDRIQIAIDDNGIGREAALARRAKSHASRGLGIVKDRIDSLNLHHDYDIQLNVIDKKDPTGQALGTTVLVTLKDLSNDKNSSRNHR